ncbi:hypothetical protein DXG01_004923 [Tephrocybe rancida]|nr:hypothetical protein DXG01_004923 [Tephrocybe rancida]
MQQPTLSGVRIRSSNDVHRIFYGVKIGRLKMLERRLDNEEREALGSGCVYVWEERRSRPNNDVTGEGMDRFTEGRHWGPSRVRDDFLFYTQKLASSRTHPWDYLIKQTYSAWVDTPTGRRKWQLSLSFATDSVTHALIVLTAAFFTDNTIDNLRTIDDFPGLRELEAPPGMFQAAKTRKSRRRESNDEMDSQRSTSVTMTQDVAESSYSLEPVTMVQPYVTQDAQLPAHPSPPLPRPTLNSASVPIRGTSTSSVLSSSILWSSPPMAGGHSMHRTPPQNGHAPFSLPPVDTFNENHLGTAHRTPSPAASAARSLVWDPSYELTSNGGSEESNRGSRLALAPIHGPNRRVYFRDPLDDKALRSLPR